MNFGEKGKTMTCPKCKSDDLLVVDVRDKPFGRWRRKECQKCGHRFNTAEITMEEYRKLRELRLKV